MPTPTSQLTDLEYLILEKEQATGWAERDATATAHGIPLMDGEYGVELDDPIREQPITTGDANATWLEQDERRLQGTLRIPLYPAKAKTILDWALLRTSNELDSYTGTHVSPDVETRRHFGLKPDRMRIEGAQKGDVVASLDLVGRYETKVGSAPAAPTMPTIEAFTFAQGRFLLSLDGGSTEIEPEAIEGFNLELANNLDRGPNKEDRADDDKSMSINWLLAGKPEISGSVTALWDRAAYGDMQRGKLQGSFRMVLGHKGGDSATVGVGGAAAGSTVSVLVDSSAGFSVDEVVRFESSAGVLKCGGKISAIADGTHITITTLEKALVSGDLVYGKALSLYVPRIYCSGVPKRRARSQRVRVTLNFRGFADVGQSLIEYIAEG